MKNKDRFDNYDIAYATYHGEIIPKFGATRMEWGFGRWLWMEHIEDTMESWKEMHRLGILTRMGDTALARATKKAEKEGPR